jgi:tetratricopeptide (TPR) repeat protein
MTCPCETDNTLSRIHRGSAVPPSPALREKGGVHLVRFFGFAVVFLAFVSCSREPVKTAPPAVSEEQSVMEELLHQTAKDPKDAEAWYHLAVAYESAAMYRESADTLNKVIALDPGRGSAYLKLGTVSNRLGRYQDAVTNFLKAIKYFPRDPVLYNNLAVSYGKLGKIDDEISSLEKAISLRPRYATARYNLAIVLLNQGKRGQAMRQYDEIKKFDEGVAAALKKEIDAKR